MIRSIIHIDQEKCNGCGACAAACHEGAIEMIGGKAILTREEHCDGLGDCLPACPTGAITFERREAPTYQGAAPTSAPLGGACPSCPGTRARSLGSPSCPTGGRQGSQSRLMQWPCQIKLIPVNAPYLEGAELLIAADCTAYAYGSFHNDFMQNRITLIGCPKLDEGDYADKLTQILIRNNVRSVTVVRMEVPCCAGLERAVEKALSNSGKRIPKQVITISTDGKILE